ncbi:MAG: hypothetical protein IJS88_02965 [Alphaproteobacteria bacterium]|nr:hypothetical protein [Alphaproteobacteria bacterium]
MKFFYLVLTLLISLPVQAQLNQYNKLHTVDLDEEIPPLQPLQREYDKATSRYRWNYDFRWNMPSLFNSEFKKQITDFGIIEKRIANADEEWLLRELKKLPKQMYQYIGPLLHTKRGLSGKILDLPGIKETKHKFPTQVASPFRNMPNLEFASPAMYLYLNPLIWGEDMASLEIPQEVENPKKKRPRMRINPNFLHKIKSRIKATDYASTPSTKPVELDLRHFNPTVSTPLSKADVRAFIRTFGALDKFRRHNNNEIRLIMIDSLINYWDTKNGIPENILLFRQIVNPCQHYVRKIRWLNLQNEFQTAIGTQGFGIKDWAYTCDKIIKAHRVHNAPSGMIWGARQQKRNALYPAMEPFLISAEEKQQMHFLLDSYARMYSTRLRDIEAIKPYNNTLRHKFLNFGKHIGGIPLVFP